MRAHSTVPSGFVQPRTDIIKYVGPPPRVQFSAALVHFWVVAHDRAVEVGLNRSEINSQEFFMALVHTSAPNRNMLGVSCWEKTPAMRGLAIPNGSSAGIVILLAGRDPINILHVERRAKKHLGKYFAKRDFTVPLKKAELTKYKTFRLEQGAKRATINRELSALHRCLVLANKEELLTVPVSDFEKFEENNIRSGIIDDEKYYAILRRLPKHAQTVWCVAYRTGVRKGELLKLRAEWLLPYWNKPEPYIEIPGFDTQGNRITKSGKAHVIPLNLHPEMCAFMEMTLAARDPQCPYLFQYRGKQLKSIRTGFENARREAGLDGQTEEGSRVIFHDTRRSAATHMVDEVGLDPEEAMEMTGHLTRSMFDRYRIGKKSKAVAAGRKVGEFHARQSESQDKFANRFANKASPERVG